MADKKHVRLGVNIDHVATLRQARGTTYPRPLEAARLCVEAGAEGITIHLREDRRHIQDADLHELKRELTIPLNLEMANAPEIVEIALKAHPEEVCLVPEKRMEVTTEGGLDVAGQKENLRSTVQRLKDAGIAVSLFVEANRRQLEASAEVGVPYVELHTGTYCDARGAKAEQELERLVEGAILAHSLGLKVNAGHGINLDTISGILQMPHLDTLNIGHSIVARAVMVGLREAVRETIEAMSHYTGGRGG
ncbi:MAG: pyridoxine 5'-phosphate synthase [Lentisphaerae bacterium GWF2_57_35]|nr:MAG: pyridoxine 5'-phosphate synthase [Lentisphaerae bacterium GWF2_57_35]